MMDIKQNNTIKEVIKNHKLYNTESIKILKCSFCQKCYQCEEIMINIIQSLAKGKRSEDGLMCITFIPGLGGDDTKELNEFIFQNYVNTLGLIDDISINFDTLEIFFTDYGIFKLIETTENCIYKIIRISPFSNKKQTSLTAVRTEFIKNNCDYNLNISDIEFQYTKSSGAGGQHINKTMSCVIATHIKTGMKVRISQERNQHKNKELAINILSQKIKNHNQNITKNKNKQEYKLQDKISWGGGFDRTINLHKNKYLKTKFNNQDYSITSIANMPLLRIIFDNLILLI